jgi:hypothetical protein
MRVILLLDTMSLALNFVMAGAKDRVVKGAYDEAYVKDCVGHPMN